MASLIDRIVYAITRKPRHYVEVENPPRTIFEILARPQDARQMQYNRWSRRYKVYSGSYFPENHIRLLKKRWEFMVPHGVTVVGFSAFDGCKSLTNVEIPESVEYIEDYTFSLCESLTHVSILGPKTDVSNLEFEGRDDVIILQTVDSMRTVFNKLKR